MEHHYSPRFDDGGAPEDDSAYQAAMVRLAELKQRPIDELTEAEKKEKLYVCLCLANTKRKRRFLQQPFKGPAHL
jgi:predicted SprT family Zn-dependent metalloprotease